MSLRRGTFTSWWYVALVLAACCTRAAAQPHGYLQTGKARDKNWHEFDSPPPVRTIEDVRRIRQWRDRMFDEPSLPTYLLAADAALKELAPAGPAAARAIADAGAALRLSGASEQKDQGNAAVTQGDAEYGATVAASQLPAGKDAAIVAAANSADGVGALTTKAQTTNDDDDGGADDDDDGALYGGALGPENVAPQRALVIAEAKKAYKALNKRRKKKVQKSKKAAVADAVDVLQQHRGTWKKRTPNLAPKEKVNGLVGLWISQNEAQPLACLPFPFPPLASTSRRASAHPLQPFYHKLPKKKNDDRLTCHPAHPRHPCHRANLARCTPLLCHARHHRGQGGRRSG